MAAYTAPTASEFSDWTAIDAEALSLDAAGFAALYASLLPLGEADVAIRVGPDFDLATLTAREVQKLRAAVADAIAMRCQKRLLNQRLLGSNDPRLVADAAEILAALKEMTTQGALLNPADAAAASVGDGESAGLPVLQVAELGYPEQD